MAPGLKILVIKILLCHFLYAQSDYMGMQRFLQIIVQLSASPEKSDTFPCTKFYNKISSPLKDAAEEIAPKPCQSWGDGVCCKLDEI